MPVRGLLVAVMALAIVGGLSYWSDKTKKAEETKAGTESTNKLVKVKDEDVRKVEIVRRNAPPTVVERGGGNQWELKSAERLKVDQTEASSLVTSYTGLSQDRVVEDKP